MEKEVEIKELKSKAYDLIAEFETLQGKAKKIQESLLEINKKIKDLHESFPAE